MKILSLLLLIAVLLGAGTHRAQAASTVSLDFFYQNLDPYGDWREVGDYGYCWQPRNVGAGWRPYSDGRWLYTDAGWTWYSDEPYSWAVYHYGRWANVASIGWIWVPGTQWGPGWVSWRSNAQYVGWAPLPPEARFFISIGFNSWVDDYYGIGPGHYRFVENRHFGSRHLGSVFIDQSRNYNIIHQTTNITNIRYENSTVYNDGPRYTDLARMSSEPIPRYKLQRRQDDDGHARGSSPDGRRPRVDGDSLSVFTPSVDARRPSSGPSRHADKVADVRVNRGWDRAGPADEMATLRNRMKGAAEAPKVLPPKPRFERGIDAPAEGDIRDSVADRPPGAREPAGKSKPAAPGSPTRDTPPAARPGAGVEKLPPAKRPANAIPPSVKPVPPPQPGRAGQPRPDMKRPHAPTPEVRKTVVPRPELRKTEPVKPSAQTPPAQRPEMKRPIPPAPTRVLPPTRAPKPEVVKPLRPKPEVKLPDKPARRPQPGQRDGEEPRRKSKQEQPESV